MRSRLLLVSLTAPAVFGIAAASSFSTTRASPGRYACAVKALTVLFWPAGHEAVPSVGFPSFPVPHLELYRPGAAYPGANFLGFLGFASPTDQVGGAQFVRTCKTVVGAKPFRARIAHNQTTTEATALTCSFARPVQFDAGSDATGLRLQVVQPPPASKRPLPAPSTVALVKLAPTGGSLFFDSSYCKPGPPPSG